MKRRFELTNNNGGGRLTIDNNAVSWPLESFDISTINHTPESKRHCQSSINLNDSGLGTSRCLSSPSSFDQQRTRNSNNLLSPLLSTPTGDHLRILRSSPSNMYIDSTPSPLRSFYISPSAPIFVESPGSSSRRYRPMQLTNPEKSIGFRFTGSNMSTISSSSSSYMSGSNENQCTTTGFIQHRVSIPDQSNSNRIDTISSSYATTSSHSNAPETPSKCFGQSVQPQPHYQFPDDSADIFASLATSTPLRDEFDHAYLHQSLDAAIKTEDMDQFYQDNVHRNLISSPSSSTSAALPRTPTSFKKVQASIVRQLGRINPVASDVEDLRDILTSDSKRSSVRSLVMPTTVDDNTVNFNLTPSKMIDFDATVDYSTNDGMFGDANRRRQHKQFHFQSPVKRPQPMTNKWLKIVCGRTRLQQTMTRQARQILGLID